MVMLNTSQRKMVNTKFNYTDIEKCKMQLQLNILIGEKNPELNWLTRPDSTRTISRFLRPDPTRGYTRFTGTRDRRV